MEASTPLEQVQGTCLVVGAAMVFALVALVVKVDPLPLLLATECRFLVSWVVSVFFMLLFKKSRGLHWFGPPELRLWLILKCVFSFSFITLWWAAIRHAPMGDCIAIIYCSPISTAILSRIFLGEELTSEYPVQVVLVVIGSLLVLDPPFLHAGPTHTSGHADYTLVFIALAVASLVPIVTRKARNCSWIEVEHVSACIACMALDPALLSTEYLMMGSLPSLPARPAREVALILLAAGGSFVGIAMETKGYQLAEVGKATMFRYVEVPFAYVLQHFGTNAAVKPGAIVGAVLILGACFVGAVGQHYRTRCSERLSNAKKVLLSENDSDQAATGA